MFLLLSSSSKLLTIFQSVPFPKRLPPFVFVFFYPLSFVVYLFSSTTLPSLSWHRIRETSLVTFFLVYKIILPLLSLIHFVNDLMWILFFVCVSLAWSQADKRRANPCTNAFQHRNRQRIASHHQPDRLGRRAIFTSREWISLYASFTSETDMVESSPKC